LNEEYDINNNCMTTWVIQYYTYYVDCNGYVLLHQLYGKQLFLVFTNLYYTGVNICCTIE